MRLPCKDGKRHWWLSGWVCEKCGLRRVDYDDAIKAVKKAEEDVKESSTSEEAG